VADTGLATIQVPLNFAESGAVLGRQGVVAGYAGEADADLCKRVGITLVGNRPLSALTPPKKKAEFSGGFGSQQVNTTHLVVAEHTRSELSVSFSVVCSNA
jgi:hypothetical protein